MNVLVYSGQETISTSFTRTIGILKSLLLPNYSVQSVTSHILLNHPWTTNCALLVIPPCNDYEPSERVATKVTNYVQEGGSFLGLYAGALISTNPSIVGRPPLRFVTPGGTSVVPDFHSNGNRGESNTLSVVFSDSLSVDDLQPVFRSFTGYQTVQDVSILASLKTTTFEDAAVLTSTIGAGRLALWSAGMDLQPGQTDSQLREAFGSILQSLGLTTAAVSGADGISGVPLPQYLLSSPEYPSTISRAVDLLRSALKVVELTELKDANDHFFFYPVAHSNEAFNQAMREDPSGKDLSIIPKHIIIGEESWLPSPESTPEFDLRSFFAHHNKMRRSFTRNEWALGDLLLYGQVVTSTQTLIDKNPTLLDALPVPLVSVASRQLSGRGRGTNSWLSPAGCLQFSILLRVNLSSLPASKLVFVQYLFALAVAQACRDDSILGNRGDAVRLKWPNDIYAVFGNEPKKIGGILVNTTFKQGTAEVIIGCGLNVLNSPPISSLTQLLEQDGSNVHLRIETVASAILSTFEAFWKEFIDVRGSFDSFMDLYLERWLHSDQLVTLSTVSPPQAVRIVGITSDYGLLRTMPEKPKGGETFYDLQPDGNSFDLMAGLIRTKQT